MWFLSFVPTSFLEFLVHAMLFIGIIGYLANIFLKAIPFVSQYRFPIQAVSVASLLVSIWFISANSTNAVWEAKIKDLEDKVKLAEEAANTKNVEIQEKIVTKTTVIKEKGKTQIEYVDRVITQDKEVVKYIEQCPVPKAIIDAHNAAAEMNKAAEGKK